MTGKERILKALKFEEPDRPPHFETMFELESEAFGLKFPDRTLWDKCTQDEKAEMIDVCMEIYTHIIERFHWDALAVYWPWSDPDGVKAAKKTFGESILIGSIVGDTTWAIENIEDWEEFSVMLIQKPEDAHIIARKKSKAAKLKFDELIDAGADFIHIVNDVAFNSGPFISPKQFSEFIIPYLSEQVEHIKKKKAIPFIHTDGDITSVLDDYISTGAACFQSIDPMAGMDIAYVKKRCHGKMALMGNVQCNILQDGPKKAIKESALYCLENASPGGGYIFGTSNTIFPGMPLEHYEYMLQVFDEFNSRKLIDK